jgi:phage baseplate assembly protein W
MATYLGFSTIDSDNRDSDNVGLGYYPGVTNPGIKRPNNKKFRLTDKDLVIQDFMNALNIPQGSIAGKPEYGTTLWTFIFEPNNAETQAMLTDEIRRVASQDPRLTINNIDSFIVDTGLILNIELAISPANEVETLSFMFDQNTTLASLTDS